MLQQRAGGRRFLGGVVVWFLLWPFSWYFASRLVSMSARNQEKAWWL